MSGTPASSAGSEQPVRSELVARVRRAIQEGTYETPEKWALTVRRLLAVLQSGQAVTDSAGLPAAGDNKPPRSPPIPPRE